MVYAAGLTPQLQLITSPKVLGAATSDTVEIGGHEQFGLDEIAGIHLEATEDTRHGKTDNSAYYYGFELNDDTLLPRKEARVGSPGCVRWLYRSMANWTLPDNATNTQRTTSQTTRKRRASGLLDRNGRWT